MKPDLIKTSSNFKGINTTGRSVQRHDFRPEIAQAEQLKTTPRRATSCAVSPHLSEHQFHRARAAANRAKARGFVINVTININWSTAGGPGGGSGLEHQALLRKNLAAWLADRRAKFVYVWTNEAAPNGKETHSHAGLHLPREITPEQLRAFLQQQLNARVPNTLKIDECKNHRRGWSGWILYCTKAVPPELWDKLEIPAKFRQPQGPVYGKRLVISKSLGRAVARAMALERPPVGPARAARRRPAKEASAPLASPGSLGDR